MKLMLSLSDDENVQDAIGAMRRIAFLVLRFTLVAAVVGTVR
jgi:hypothetical protein